MEKYESEVRLRVLDDSLQLESYATFWLSILLNIDAGISRSLGNKSTAIPLNNKIYLLIDMGALNNIEKEFFLKFMEIRNQFMHNPKAVSFTTCFGFINIGGWLLKKLKKPEMGSEEEQNFAYYNQISKRVLSNATMIFNEAKDKIEERKDLERYKLLEGFISKKIPFLKELKNETFVDSTKKKEFDSFMTELIEHFIKPIKQKQYSF